MGAHRIRDQRICCDFDIRISIGWMTADSMNAVETRCPPRLGMAVGLCLTELLLDLGAQAL